MPTTSDLSGLDLPAIDIRDVSVHYRLPHERINTFKEFVIQWLRGRVAYEDLCALSHVTIAVRRGESLGIIGRNGAGKTTLMKVIARVLRPTEGSAEVRGTLAPLLELGAGFDMELSGRENVFLNGAILGMSEAEINRKFDSIVAFSELEKFLDSEVRHYSSGMFSRLAFAVAVHTECDIFLIDEVLAVGDQPFRRKCMKRIRELKAEGRTMVYVSHSPKQVLNLCERGIVLETGRMIFEGSAEEAVRAVGYILDTDTEDD